MVANEVRNTERPTYWVHKKTVYGKASSQLKMLRGNMFSGKCSCRLIRTSDENSWKNFNEVAGI